MHQPETLNYTQHSGVGGGARARALLDDMKAHFVEGTEPRRGLRKNKG